MNDNTSGRKGGLWMCAASALLALSACGGGGGNTPTAATPSSLGGGNFAVTNEYQSDSGGSAYSYTLLVVDLRTGQVPLRLKDTSSTGYGYISWGASNRFEPNGSSATYKGYSQLFTIENQGLIQRDLGGDAVGAPRAISALTNACSIYGTRETSADGTEGWLEVETSGPDGDCSTPADNETRLIPFGASTSDSGKLSGSNGLSWVDDIRADFTSPTVGILAIDRKTGLLNLYSSDLSRVLSNVSVGRVIDSAESAQLLYVMPTNPSRLAVRVGQSLYMATLAGTQLTLGKPLRTLQSGSSVEPISDGQNIYLADGNDLLQISQTGATRTVTTTNATLGSVNWMQYSGGALIVTQSNYDQPPPYSRTISAYTVDTGMVTTLATSTADIQPWLVWAKDGQVWLAKSSKTSSSTELISMKVDRSNAVTFASNVQFVSELFAPTLSIASGVKLTQLLWCEVDASGQGCAGTSLQQYDLGSGNTVNLGKIPLDTGWPTSYGLYSPDLGTDDRPGLLSSHEQSKPNSSGIVSYRTSTLWFVPGQSGSLKRVATQP